MIVTGSAPCRTGAPSDFIQLLERPRSSSAPNGRHIVPGTSAVIPPPLTRSPSSNSIIQSTGSSSYNAAEPRHSPVHQQQQSPVSTSPSKTSPPSGITLNTTVQIIQVIEIMNKLFMLPNTAIIIVIIIIIIIIIIILLFWNMSATSFHELCYVRFIAMECLGTFFLVEKSHWL